jgi:hypothetical protein
MTTPPESLFELLEPILDDLSVPYCSLLKIEKICDAHDQRLREVEQESQTLRLSMHDLTDGITGTLQKDRIEALEQRLREVEAERDGLRAESANNVAAFLNSDLFQHAVCMWLWGRDCLDGDPDALVWTGGPTPEPYGPAYLATFDSDAFVLRECIKKEIALWDEAEKKATTTPQPENQR